MSKVDSEERFRRNLIKFLEDFLGTMEKISDKYEKLLRDELNYIAESTVDRFYEDYDPSSYQRYGDIYNTYKITVTRDEYEVNCEIDYGYQYMKHHGDLNSYLFDIVFEKGWHGGADNGFMHPEPGVPWYKDLPEGYDWLRRAARSDSPYEEMDYKIAEYIEKWNKQFRNEINRFLNKKAEDFRYILLQREKGR